MKGKNLIIVESPGKVDKIRHFLGDDFVVKASKGHIRDLDEKKLGIDIEHGFRPEYVIPDDKKKVVAELKSLASKSDTIWLASDEDREGEAIAWHLFDVLGLSRSNTKRIVFNEITKEAILNAIKEPRDIDMNLVDAQQARRVLDRLVGFELSPILWRKVQPKLSAGRVQSVALRLVVDREKEIIAFQNEAYYRVEGTFLAGNTPFKAALENRFSTKEEARKFLEDSIGATYAVSSVEKKEGIRMPSSPFTTSTLQQEAARRLHFPVSTTMRVAQTLYEKGLITYMRTDSTNLSSLALGAAKKYITETFGTDYSRPRQFKTKSKGAQEAHEAIRPTYLGNPSIEGTAQEKKLYELIWKRTIASQMAEAKVLATTIKISSDKRNEKYVANANEVLFDGFLKVYSGSDDSSSDMVVLPSIGEGEILRDKSIVAEAKFTAAPPRYSEGTLIKKLDELGIGRPSTYVPTIETIKHRDYIVVGDKEGRKVATESFTLSGGKISSKEKMETIGAEKGRLIPQEIGVIVTDYLQKNFPDILDYDFTASVEKEFDEIAGGEVVWNSAISEFYAPFHKRVSEVLSSKDYARVNREIGKDPATGETIVAKYGQWGPYVQKGEGENRVYASLGKGQLIENITLEEALKLFALPRTVGQIDGVDVIAMKGKYGPYLKFGDKNFKLPRGNDPLTITIEKCKEIIEAEAAPKQAQEAISEFDGGNIKVIEGRYGPYIKAGNSNYKIPKGKDAATLTEADCKEIIASSKPTSSSRRRFSK